MVREATDEEVTRSANEGKGYTSSETVGPQPSFRQRFYARREQRNIRKDEKQDARLRRLEAQVAKEKEKTNKERARAAREEAIREARKERKELRAERAKIRRKKYASFFNAFNNKPKQAGRAYGKFANRAKSGADRVSPERSISKPRSRKTRNEPDKGFDLVGDNWKL